MWDDSGSPWLGHDTASGVRWAFRAAHLITASVAQAEKAVLHALERFDPERDSERTLLRYAIAEALQEPASESPSHEASNPPELGAVLALPDLLRRCFVLRFLVRLSPSTCAGLLHLSVAAVNDCSTAAVRRLAGSVSFLRTEKMKSAGGCRFSSGDPSIS